MAKDVDDVVTAIDNLGKKIVNMQNTIQNTMTRGTDATLEELRSSSRVNARVEIAKQIAEVTAIKPIVQEQIMNLNAEVERISERQDMIVGRYDAMEKELEDSYRRDIRRLGAHIYDILENDYQRGLESRYNRSGCGMLSEAVKLTDFKRNVNIHDHLDRAAIHIQKFVDRRQIFRQSLNSKLIKNKGEFRYKEVAVPFWMIRVRKKDGKLINKIIGPSKLVGKSKGLLKFSIKEDEDYKEISKSLYEQADHIFQNLPEPQRADLSKHSLSQAIEALGNQGRNTISNALVKLILQNFRQKSPTISL